MLLPDTGGATVALLTQLVAQSQPNGSTSVVSSVIPSTVAQPFTPSRIAIRINILMFLSLFLSLTCALMSTLIQQWAREYLQYAQLSAPPQKRGRVRAYLFEGLTKFQMRRVVDSIPVLLHISVFLFFFAFSEFLRTVNDTVGLAARCSFFVLLSTYLILSILPLVISSAPYQTALTTPLRPCAVFLRFIFRLPMCAAKGIPPIPFRSIPATAIQYNRSRDLLADTERRAASLDYLALQWLLKGVGEEGMDKFVIGLPALINSPFITDATETMRALVANGMLKRVEEHLMSSMSSRELSQAASIARAHGCLESLDAIFSVLDRWSDRTWFTGVTSALVKSSDAFRTRHDSAFALRAACIRALTFHKLISPFSTQAAAHPLWLPPHLMPLARRLRIWTRVNSRHWRNQSDLEAAERRLESEENGLRNMIIYDGHLINFLVLIRDVLSYAERPMLDLTFVWETLEAMVDTITIVQPTPSVLACSRLDEVHAEVRECFNVPNNLVHRSLHPHVTERYSQLLGFMDKVAKELSLVSLLSVKSVQPGATEPFFATGDLRLRYDHIYAKDPFSFMDVLDAFLSNLPAFIESAGKPKARDTIEKLVAVDGLLRNICGHLKTRISPEMPSATRDSMFITCLQILEQVFTLLKDSPTIRWYELDIKAVIDAANSVVFSDIAGEPSLHAYCALGIMINVIIGHLRSRNLQGQGQEEQLFILMIYDWLCLGDEQERIRREDRRPGDEVTSLEASSPQYLRNLLANGPLQNFSMMAFHMVPHLKNKEAIPEIVLETLNMLKDVVEVDSLDAPIAGDPVALSYFDTVRDSAIEAAKAAEGNPSEEQLRLLEYLNTVGGRLGRSKLSMPSPVLLPGKEFVAPNRIEYTPAYI